MRGSESRRSRCGSIAGLYAAPAGAASQSRPLVRLALRPGHLLAVERHAGQRHLGRAVLHLPRMGKIDQRIVRLVIDAVDHLLLPDQADALLEHLLAALT